MSNEINTLYRINKKDEIVFVSEGRRVPAILNGASNLSPDKLLFRSLWNFITDASSKYLYREILKRVRDGHDMKFHVHRDPADQRRSVELHIRLREDGDVEIGSQTLKTETLPRLDLDLLPSEEVLIVCSWCNRFNVKKGEWQELENAVVSLQLFENSRYPPLSHGMCGECYQEMVTRLKQKN